MEIIVSGPFPSWQIDGETVEIVRDFIFLGSKITADGDCSHEIKRCLFLGRQVMTNLDSIFGEGNGTPLQYSCLENPMDRGAWKAAVHGVAEGWTWLSDFTFYIMWNAGLDEAQAGIKIAGRNINNIGYADDTTLTAKSEEELKSLLMKVKEESEKVGLKLNIQKMKIMASGPITSWEIDGETVETVSDFIFLAPKSLQMVIAAMKLKDAYSLEEKLLPT